MTPPSVRKVVFAPDLIGASLFDLHSRRVLELWRDSQLLPVTNRDLLSAHLRNLRRLGLPATLVKRWAYWLASPEKNTFIEKPLPSTNSIADLCEGLAKVSRAEMIVCWKLPSKRNPSVWMPAESYIKS